MYAPEAQHFSCLSDSVMKSVFRPASNGLLKRCRRKSAFFKDSSVVGQNCQRAHFPSPPPRIVCDRRGKTTTIFRRQSDSSLIVGRIIDPRPCLRALSIDPFVPFVTHWYTIYNHYFTLFFFDHMYRKMDNLLRDAIANLHWFSEHRGKTSAHAPNYENMAGNLNINF